MTDPHAADLRDILVRQIQAAGQSTSAAWPFAQATILTTLDKLLAHQGVPGLSGNELRPVFKRVHTPKDKRDFPGRLVRITQQLDEPAGRVPAGTLATVLEVRRRGLSLVTETCRCCDVRMNLEGVPLYQVEFVMPEGSGPV